MEMCNGREGFICYFRYRHIDETPPYTLPGEGIAQSHAFSSFHKMTMTILTAAKVAANQTKRP
jgi:hypothetical protein